MTAITSLKSQPRRAGELGVHSVNHFNFVVPDLKQAAAFYGSFGLDVREGGDGLGLYTFGHEHRCGRVDEGAAKKSTYLSFGCFPEDLAPLWARLQGASVPELDPPARSESNGVWFRDPDGNLIEMRVAEKSSPDEKAMQSNLSSPPDIIGSHARYRAPVVKLRRLPHILIFTSDVLRAIGFYGRVLGLQLSDRSGDGITFMHGIYGSDHQKVAFAKSNGPGLYSLSWNLGSFHEVGLGAMQMGDRGFSSGWGMGRHVPGSNHFRCVRDPWRLYAKYSSDIDYIPADYDWDAADHPEHDAFYVWGPIPPSDLVHNHEMDT